jgi:hypothetical protein
MAAYNAKNIDLKFIEEKASEKEEKHKKRVLGGNPNGRTWQSFACLVFRRFKAHTFTTVLFILFSKIAILDRTYTGTKLTLYIPHVETANRPYHSLQLNVHLH